MCAYLYNNLRLCNGTAGNLSVVVFFVGLVSFRVRPEIKMSRLALVALFTARVADTSQPIMIDMMAKLGPRTHMRDTYFCITIFMRSDITLITNKSTNIRISRNRIFPHYINALGCGSSTHFIYCAGIIVLVYAYFLYYSVHSLVSEWRQNNAIHTLFGSM